MGGSKMSIKIVNKDKALLQEINEFQEAKKDHVFWWLGQIGFAFLLEGKIIYLDAYLSEHEKRTVEPIIHAENVTNADYVVGTHDHIDHIDKDAWKKIAKASPQAKFIVPKLYEQTLLNEIGVEKSRVIGLDEKTPFEEENILFEAIPSAHEFLDTDESTGLHPYLGIVLTTQTKKIYHSGDTCLYQGYYEKLQKMGKLDLMILPINGRDALRYASNTIGNMTYQEAVDVAGTIRPNLVVPAHYDMFAHNSEDPKNFTEYLEVKYQSSIPYWVGNYGEPVSF